MKSELFKRFRAKLGIFLIAFVLTTIGLILWQRARQREPEFQGRPLKEWLRLGNESSSLKDQEAAIMAVRQIGTNGLPILVRMMSARPSRLSETLADLLGRQSLIKYKMMPPWESQTHAFSGFCMLGTSAAPAVPELTKLLETDERGYATLALAHIPPEGPKVLLQALTNKTFILSSNAARIRWQAINALAELQLFRENSNSPPAQLNSLQPDSETVIQAIIQCLNDDAPAVRSRAVRVLEIMKSERQQIIQALINTLQNASSDVVNSAVDALGKFGPNAKEAIPALSSMLNHPDPNVRSSAAKALKKINSDESDNQK